MWRQINDRKRKCAVEIWESGIHTHNQCSNQHDDHVDHKGVILATEAENLLFYSVSIRQTIAFKP